MPVLPCSDSGRQGFQWGENGVCYTGKDARKNALKQGIATELAKKRRGEETEFASIAEETGNQELTKILALENAKIEEVTQILLEIEEGKNAS